MKQDRKFIQERFNRDGIRAPESLSKEKIQKLLAAGGEEPFKEHLSEEPQEMPVFPKRRIRGGSRPLTRGLVAAAACFLVALLVFPAAYERFSGDSGTSFVPGRDGLYTFESYSEINKMVKQLERQNQNGGKWLFRNEEAILMEEDMAAEETTGAAPASSSANSSDQEMRMSSEFSETYLQVKDVDEADIVKTDGKYIYYVNRNEEVQIYSAADGETQKVAEISNDPIEEYVQDLYLKDDLLVTIGRVYDEEGESAAVATYDVSDHAAPQLKNVFRQSGSVVSSRMVGDYVYLVTSYYAGGGRQNVPKVTAEGVYEKMKVEDICCVPEPASASCVVLSAVDTASGTGTLSNSKAVFGTSDDIYCNNENLYVAAFEYDKKSDGSVTRIIRASLDGASVRFEAEGIVSGTIDGQFSMDEKDGYFRIATTANRGGTEVNYLYILDQDLKEVGKVRGFARNESIRAVRYIGDKAYVITFRQVDPLFVIDLSDPANPFVEGEVEIDGFSTLLGPIEGDRLLGIGYLTQDNGYGGVYKDGLKLALFDISDPARPAVLDSEEFSGMSSPAQETHLALLVNQKEGYYAIPYNRYFSEDNPVWTDRGVISDAEESGTASEEVMPRNSYTGGVLVFGADQSLHVFDNHQLTQEDGHFLQRSVFIGGWIYTLDEQGTIYSFPFH